MVQTFERPNRTCPYCKEESLSLDMASGTFRCSSCGRAGIDPYKTATGEGSLPEPPSSHRRTKMLKKQDMDDRPSIPAEAQSVDLVEDFEAVEGEDGTIRRGRKVSVTYCPKPKKIDRSEFDPNSPWAQIASIRFKQTVQKQRRYMRDLARRAKTCVENEAP